MEKRTFLKTAGVLGAGFILSPLNACRKAIASSQPASTSAAPMPFLLPALGYAYTSLEPYIDAATMEIHHSKHHAAYVANLNKAVEGNPSMYAQKSVEALCREIKSDSPSALRNNAGGHFNHTAFWNWIAPGGKSQPDETVGAAIQSAFGSFEEFSKAFGDAAKNRFGSGWAWLCVGADKKLFISSTPNQDNPLMAAVVDKPGIPILGIDVWEHAYYLNYQNKRADYIASFMKIINWDQVLISFQSATKG